MTISFKLPSLKIKFQHPLRQLKGHLLLNDKNRTIFNPKYCKGFLISVLGKRMEILYYFKPFDTKIIIRQVDYFLFLLAISSKYNFFHLFLIVVVNLVRKQLLRFYGDQILLYYFVISYVFNYVNFLVVNLSGKS